MRQKEIMSLVGVGLSAVLATQNVSHAQSYSSGLHRRSMIPPIDLTPLPTQTPVVTPVPTKEIYRADETIPEAVRALAAKVCLIKTFRPDSPTIVRHVGSGFAIGKRAMLFARHVPKDTERKVVETPDPDVVYDLKALDVITTATCAELGEFRLTEDPNISNHDLTVWYSDIDLPVVETASIEAVSLGTTLYSVYVPEGSNSSVISPGIYVDRTSTWIELVRLHAGRVPGFSGGIVALPDGKVVGMGSAGEQYNPHKYPEYNKFYDVLAALTQGRFLLDVGYATRAELFPAQ